MTFSFTITAQGQKLFHSEKLFENKTILSTKMEHQTWPQGIYSDTCTVRAEIFAVVLFSRISRVKPSRKFPLQFMSIYSNDNISKIAKLTPRELPHLAKTAKITVRENNGVYSITFWMNVKKDRKISSAESQKGTIADQRCSVENQKGAIAIHFVQQ